MMSPQSISLSSIAPTHSRRHRKKSPRKSSRSSKRSLLRSIRLCHEASMLLRTAGWSKGDLQQKLSSVTQDVVILSSVDVPLAKALGERERHNTRTTSASISHEDYDRLFSMATTNGVSVWAFLNQAIIQKFKPSSGA